MISTRLGRIVVVLLVTAHLLPGSLLTQATQAGPSAAADRVVASLRNALQKPQNPFELDVFCPNEAGVRAFRLFGSGVAIWNDRKQFNVAEAIRNRLLRLLLDHGFAHFDARYGEDPEKERLPEAALRITCQVRVVIDGIEKSSTQRAEGEQSEELARLAEAILNSVEAQGVSGTEASSLEDGLEKLLAGDLAWETLRLRYVRLPAVEGVPGLILRIVEGRVSRQDYRPGREVGKPAILSVERTELDSLLRSLVETQPWTWPVNLWSGDHLELEIEVLNQRKAVVARPFSRLSTQTRGEAQARFKQLVAGLEALS